MTVPYDASIEAIAARGSVSDREFVKFGHDAAMADPEPVHVIIDSGAVPVASDVRIKDTSAARYAVVDTNGGLLVLLEAGSSVDVIDRAGRLLGHVTIDNASLTVGGTVAVSNFPSTFPLSSTEDQILQDIKRAVTDFETRLDYDTRTDSNPVYVGKNTQGTATSVATWVIQKLTYDASARLTRAEVLTGKWDDRATLGW